MGWDKLCLEHFYLSIWNQEIFLQSKAHRTFLLSAYEEGKMVLKILRWLNLLLEIIQCQLS